MKIFGLQLTGCRKSYFLIFTFFIFFKFQMAIVKNLMAKSSFFIMDYEGSYDILLRKKYFLFMFILTRLLSKTVWKNYHFLIQISKVNFKIQNRTEYLDVKPCDTKMTTFWIRGKILKKGLFYLDPILVFLAYFLKDWTKKFLNIYKSVVIESFKLVPLCPIKWRPFKVFVKLHKSPHLTVNIAKGVVSGMRQLLTTESPWKFIKNTFSFILKALFVFKVFKFFSRLFGGVEKMVWLERG